MASFYLPPSSQAGRQQGLIMYISAASEDLWTAMREAVGDPITVYQTMVEKVINQFKYSTSNNFTEFIPMQHKRNTCY